MSAIANFKKRHLAEKAKKDARESVSQSVAETGKKLVDTLQNLSEQSKQKTALELLASLLGCDEQDAIAKATELVEQKARVVEMTIGVDLADGSDQTVIAEVTKYNDGNITEIKSGLQDSADTAMFAANDLADTADTVNETAGTLNDAANDAAGSATELSNTANDVADSASTIADASAEISAAASEIKEVAEDVKKPSEAPQSSPSEKSTKPSKSSKK